MSINFKSTRAEFDAIILIAKRAESIQPPEMKQTRMDWIMDITACHNNGCPLKLAELAEANEFDFAHDVYGIRRHIDRTNGKLLDCFVPRYAAQEVVS